VRDLPLEEEIGLVMQLSSRSDSCSSVEQRTSFLFYGNRCIGPVIPGVSNEVLFQALSVLS
jgi:hypothetical protein